MDSETIMALIIAVWSLIVAVLSKTGHLDRFFNGSPPEVKPVEYVEYESSEYLRLHWMDETKIGLCRRCGCDDVPIVSKGMDAIGRPTGEGLCKWCVEKARLDRHLEDYESRKS